MGSDWRPRRTLPLTMTAPGRPEAIMLLTLTEWAVLAGIMDGLADCEIAARLGVSVKTLKNHNWSIHQKVGVSGQFARIALVLWAYAYVPALRRPFTPIAPLPSPYPTGSPTMPAEEARRDARVSVHARAMRAAYDGSQANVARLRASDDDGGDAA